MRGEKGGRPRSAAAAYFSSRPPNDPETILRLRERIERRITFIRRVIEISVSFKGDRLAAETASSLQKELESLEGASLVLAEQASAVAAFQLIQRAYAPEGGPAFDVRLEYRDSI